MTRIGELCAGYTGLGMAVKSVLGGELAWTAEIDEDASKILAHRFPSVPNHGDITAASWGSAEPVDVFCAGFPCQPVSTAGKGLGEADERWIWPAVAGAVRDLRPGLVFLENVSALVVRGLAGIVADLAEIGYVGSWCCLRASDVGACHRRDRVFILARPAANAAGGLRRTVAGSVAGGEGPGIPEASGGRVRAGNRGAGDDGPSAGPDAPANARGQRRDGRPGVGGDGWPAPVGEQACSHGGDGSESLAQDADRAAGGERRQPAPGQATGGGPRPDAGGSGGVRVATDARGEGLEVGAVEPDRDELQAAERDRGDASADADGGGRGPEPRDDGRGRRGRLRATGHQPGDIAWGVYEPAIRRWEAILGRPTPRPTEPGRTGERLSPRFVEWMMGLPEGWVTDVPGLSRNAQLKALGNGVVPAQAAMALRLLLDRAGHLPLAAAALEEAV